MENIPIVNLQDEVIGHKDRGSIDCARDIIRTASLWITNSNGDVLLALRRFDGEGGAAKWEQAIDVRVRRDDYDSYEKAIFRAGKEELGVYIIGPLAEGPKQFITTPCRYFIQWYTFVIDRDLRHFPIRAHKVEQLRWISHKQLVLELHAQPEKYIDTIGETLILFE